MTTSEPTEAEWRELMARPGALWVIPTDEPAAPPHIAQDARTALTAAGWPRHATPEALQAADAHIEAIAQVYDGAVFGFLGDVLRWTWQQIRPQPACDCPMNPHHRWNCATTPIWAQTIRDLGCNPWTAITRSRIYVDLSFPPHGINRWDGLPGTRCGIGPCCRGDGHSGRCLM